MVRSKGPEKKVEAGGKKAAEGRVDVLVYRCGVWSLCLELQTFSYLKRSD